MSERVYLTNLEDPNNPNTRYDRPHLYGFSSAEEEREAMQAWIKTKIVDKPVTVPNGRSQEYLLKRGYIGVFYDPDADPVPAKMFDRLASDGVTDVEHIQGIFRKEGMKQDDDGSWIEINPGSHAEATRRSLESLYDFLEKNPDLKKSITDKQTIDALAKLQMEKLDLTEQDILDDLKDSWRRPLKW